MTLYAASLQFSLAGNLIESALGQAQRAQTDLVVKLARIALSQNILILLLGLRRQVLIPSLHLTYIGT